MRVTNQMFYTNMQYNYRNSMTGLYQADKQLSSGLKIQYGYEDSATFVDTMRLDYNITTLDQVQKSSSKAQTFADNSDKVLTQVSDIFATFKTKLIQAANSGVNKTTNMEAIANDLKALKESMTAQVNTSINGQFLFSGTAMSKKPIDINGNYHGNDQVVSSVTGSKVQLPYNISGYDLFLGRDGDYNKIMETNVQLTNQLEQEKKEFINENSTVRELVGDYDGNTVFYIQGRKPSGESFRNKFEITPDSKMSNVLQSIGEQFGNTSDNELVNVSMNKDGQIIIKDNKVGNSLLDFSLVAATDRAAGVGASGNADNNNPGTIAGNVKFTEFTKSGLKDETGAELDPFNYDRAQFDKSGKHIIGNVSQIVQKTNLLATNSTKLSEVAGSSLEGQTFTLQIKDISGTDVTTTINLEPFTPAPPATPTSGSTFSVGGNTYNIYDGEGNFTPANDVTYKQLNDIISMVSSDILPASVTSTTDYDNAIVRAKDVVDVNLDYRGRISLTDRYNSASQIEVSLYNNNSGTFATSPATADPSLLTFSSNNALTMDEPYVDIFKDLDQIISAVRNEINEADPNSSEPRNPGIEAGLKRLDHLSDHVAKRHSQIGSMSNALKSASERAELLTVNIKTIQSEVIDTDYGEAYMRLTKYSMSYQAILQATAKINSLSLLNYM